MCVYWLLLALLQTPPLVVPRVIFELQPPDLLRALEEQPAIIDMVVEETKKEGLDGVVSRLCAQYGRAHEHA